MFSPSSYFDQLVSVQQSASFAGGLFVGTVWLVVVLFLGVVLLTYIKGRFDP